MGSFYVNFTVQGAEQGAIVKSLQAGKRTALVAPSRGGMTVFYDSEADNQDESTINVVGAKVSTDTNSAVLAVLNHDDDILCYWLFRAGKLMDEYNSCPGYFTDGDPSPVGGDARRLCTAFGVPSKADEVDRVLRDTSYVFALERHEALCRLLQQPWDYLCLGYQYASQGELPMASTNKILSTSNSWIHQIHTPALATSIQTVEANSVLE